MNKHDKRNLINDITTRGKQKHSYIIMANEAANYRSCERKSTKKNVHSKNVQKKNVTGACDRPCERIKYM